MNVFFALKGSKLFIIIPGNSCQFSRTLKILRFESNTPENENHQFTIFQTNQHGERKTNERCYPFNYIIFHFKTTRKSIRIRQNNIFEKIIKSTNYT